MEGRLVDPEVALTVTLKRGFRMATTHLISVEEYLHSTFEPDAEYVEGRIVQRSMPKKPHSKIQSYLDRTLYEKGHTLGYEVWVEQRVRTRRDPARYRIPDVCLTFGEPDEDIFSEPPFLCVEVLSPDDAALEVRIKVDEYLAFGVAYVWIVDPISLGGEIHTRDRIERVRDGRYRAGDIEVNLQKTQQPR
jgi:Uma2 family endonuclease